jgi:hypothetical protein
MSLDETFRWTTPREANRGPPVSGKLLELVQKAGHFSNSVVQIGVKSLDMG